MISSASYNKYMTFQDALRSEKLSDDERLSRFYDICDTLRSEYANSNEPELIIQKRAEIDSHPERIKPMDALLLKCTINKQAADRLQILAAIGRRTIFKNDIGKVCFEINGYISALSSCYPQAVNGHGSNNVPHNIQSVGSSPSNHINDNSLVIPDDNRQVIQSNSTIYASGSRSSNTNNELTKLMSENTTMKNRLSDSEKRVKELEKRLNELSMNRSATGASKAEIDKLKLQNEQLIKQRDRYCSGLKDLQKRYNELNLNQHQSVSKEEAQKLETENANLKSDLKTLQKKYNERQWKIIEAENNYKATLELLEAEKAKTRLSEQINGIEETADSAENQIKALRAKLDSIRKLSRRLSASERSITELEEAAEEL